MPIAIDPKSTFDYVLKEDRALPEGEQTVFHIGVYTMSDEARIQDLAATHDSKTNQTSIRSGTMEVETLRAGLHGWRNFFFGNGTEAKFETNPGIRRDGRAVVSDASLDLLSSKHRKELSEAITERNRMTDDERKNCQLELAS